MRVKATHEGDLPAAGIELVGDGAVPGESDFHSRNLNGAEETVTFIPGTSTGFWSGSLGALFRRRLSTKREDPWRLRVNKIEIHYRRRNYSPKWKRHRRERIPSSALAKEEEHWMNLVIQLPIATARIDNNFAIEHPNKQKFGIRKHLKLQYVISLSALRSLILIFSWFWTPLSSPSCFCGWIWTAIGRDMWTVFRFFHYSAYRGECAPWSFLFLFLPLIFLSLCDDLTLDLFTEFIFSEGHYWNTVFDSSISQIGLINRDA